MRLELYTSPFENEVIWKRKSLGKNNCGIYDKFEAKFPEKILSPFENEVL